MGVADAAAERGLVGRAARWAASPRYAAWFDVDWAAGDGRIQLPVLGDDAEPTTTSRGSPVGELRYYEHRYPIAPGTARPGDRPAEVHARQHYELVNYRRADTEQNYRRFFAVTDLAGIRVEDPTVFDATPRRDPALGREGDVDGIRIDHPDGLADPAGYLAGWRAAAPDAWIMVEKILEPGEALPPDWPVAGTTGYDALAEVEQPVRRPGRRGRCRAGATAS